MKCRVCSSETKKIYDAVILNKYNIHFFLCNTCEFLQTEQPYWLSESYHDAIGSEDTGVMLRNLYLSRQASVIISAYFNRKGKFLDYAGGYGILTRLMRDIGFDFYWSDLYCKNLTARGFEFTEKTGRIELITAFETFEHFVNPVEEIEKMLAISKNIFFSTELLPRPIPKPEQWWYFSLKSGQHVSLYSKKTLQFIAKKYGLNLYSNNKNQHLLTTKKINPFIFKLLLKLSSLGLASFIKLTTKTKTFEDMKEIITLSKS